MPDMQWGKASWKLNQAKKTWRALRPNVKMKDLCQVKVSIIEEKTARDGMVLLKYLVRKVSVYILQDACMYPSHLMKVSNEFGSPRNVENKVSSNEINEVLEEEDERQHKSPHSKVGNWKMILKNHVEMQLWNIKWREVKSRKKGKIMSTLSKSSGKYSHWLEYKTRIGKRKSVSIGIILIHGDFYTK